MHRYFLEIAYDGEPYCGFQRQPGAPTVQQTLEEGLAVVLRQPIGLVAAGRTDTGVHASQSFAHFDLPEPARAQLARALNGWLPPSIAVRNVYVPTQPSIHARFSAISRAYQYRMLFSKDPFRRPTALLVRHSLDLQAMKQVCDLYMRTHDFASFCKADGNSTGTLCNMYEARLALENGLLVYHVRANRFLRGMVRAMVGTLLEVGKGRLTLKEVEALLLATDRRLAPSNAPANGLMLTEVRYTPGALRLLETAQHFPGLVGIFESVS